MKLVQRTKKFVAMLVVGAMMLATTPRPAYAMIGCPSDLDNVSIQAPSLAGTYGDGEYWPASDGSGMGWTGGINSGIFVGEATKTSTGLGSDTYTYVARDIVSGAEITGTFEVKSVDCLINAAKETVGLSTTYVGQNTTIQTFNQVNQ